MDTYASIHIPKTAGTFFAKILKNIHPDIFYLHYGPKSPDNKLFTGGQRLNFSHATFETYFSELASLSKPRLSIIHGHIWGKTLKELVPDCKLMVWLREPAQRLRSHYEYWKRTPQPTNPKYDLFKRADLSFMEFATNEAFVNRQSLFTEGMHIEDYAFVGIVEHMQDSLNRLHEPFPSVSDFKQQTMVNSNPKKELGPYKIGVDELRTIRKANSKDYALYESAMFMLGYPTG